MRFIASHYSAWPMRGALLCLYGLFAITGRQIVAQTQPSCTIGFAQTEAITVDWKRNSEYRIELVSLDGKEHQVKVQINDLAMRTVDGKSLPNTEFITIEPESGKIKNGSLQVLLRVTQTFAVKPGRYLGRIRAVTDDPPSSACAAFRQIQILVPDAAPLVDKVTLWAYRSWPGLNFECSNCAIPLIAPISEVKTTALEKGVPIGGARNDQGGVCWVYWTGEPATTPDGDPELRLVVRNLDRCGKYEGKVRLQKASDKEGVVDLVINAADEPYLPIIIVGAGILLALFMKQYAGKLRTVWMLLAQDAALGVRFREAQRRFDAASKGTTFAAYSIALDLAEQRRKFRDAISQLAKSGSLSIDETNEDFKAIITQRKAFESAIDEWGDFAEKLIKLKTFLNGTTGPPPAAFPAPSPRLLSQEIRLLDGMAMTLEEFAQRRTAIAEAQAAARSWFSARDRIARSEALLEFVRTKSDLLNDEQKSTMRSVGAGLAGANIQLWEVEDVSALNELLVSGGSLNTTEQSLYTLAGVVSQTPVEHAKASAAALAVEGALMTEASLSLPAVAPADDAERERFYTNAINRWDIILTLLAFVIAVLTGLNTYYLGKPFGTLQDYVTLLLWGLVTKLIVDTAGVALGWLFSRFSAART